MKHIQVLLARLDRLQQKHLVLAFPLAVFKKYNEDSASNQVALVTYYGLLSLFPLLLVTFTLLRHSLAAHPSLQHRVLDATFKYFPVIGTELQQNVHTLHGSGFALIAGIVVFIYGSLGVASAIQNALNHVWQIEIVHRPGFPGSLLRNIGIVLLGGGLMFVVTVLSVYLTHLNTLGPIFRVFVILVTILINACVFLVVFRLGTSNQVATRDMIRSALIAATGWQVLELLGNYLILHELRNLSALYGSFAIALGLLFWIALQAEVTVYAMEVDVVRARKLWPRTFFSSTLTYKDEHVYRTYAKTQRRQKREDIEVHFR